MVSATFRIVGVPERASSIRERLPFSVVVRGDVEVSSRISTDLPLNDHLVWIWGMLKGHRRFLASIKANGGRFECVCRIPRGAVHLLPNAAEMLHLLGAELILEAK